MLLVGVFYFVFAYVRGAYDYCGYGYCRACVEQVLRRKFQSYGICSGFVDVPAVGVAVSCEMVLVRYLLSVYCSDPAIIVGLAKDKIEWACSVNVNCILGWINFFVSERSVILLVRRKQVVGVYEGFPFSKE